MRAHVWVETGSKCERTLGLWQWRSDEHPLPVLVVQGNFEALRVGKLDLREAFGPCRIGSSWFGDFADAPVNEGGWQHVSQSRPVLPDKPHSGGASQPECPAKDCHPTHHFAAVTGSSHKSQITSPSFREDAGSHTLVRFLDFVSLLPGALF